MRDTPSSCPGGAPGYDSAVDSALVGLAAARLGGRDSGLPVGGGPVGHILKGSSMSVALAFENLTLGYERHPAVHHLDGVVQEGSLVAICGPNGAGKSTLFKGIVGLLTPLAGRIDVKACRVQDIAYLPQIADIDRSFPINVYDMVAMGLWRRAGLFGGIGRKEREQIHDAIGAVGLRGFEERPIASLSGGQMQRTLFARLLLQNARVILLDEPFNAIDAKTT